MSCNNKVVSYPNYQFSHVEQQRQIKPLIKTLCLTKRQPTVIPDKPNVKPQTRSQYTYIVELRQRSTLPMMVGGQIFLIEIAGTKFLNTIDLSFASTSVQLIST